MTLQEIDQLTLESRIYVILDRLLDLSVLNQGEEILSIIEAENYYDSVVLNSKLTKPSLIELEQELNIIKDELRVIENARLAEVERVTAIENRWQALDDIHGVYLHLNISVRNPMLDLKRIIDENDVDYLSNLETAHSEIVAAESLKSSNENLVELGKNNRLICQEILDLIDGHVMDKNFTSEQKDQMETDYSQIMSALSFKRILKAKALIQAIDTSSSVITEDMKTSILAVYTKHGI